jgi:hypothetical protein
VRNITASRNGLADVWCIRRLLEGVVTAGRRLGDSGYGTRRALYGVVAWILILLAAYWLVAEWHSLPAMAASVLTSAG